MGQRGSTVSSAKGVQILCPPLAAPRPGVEASAAAARQWLEKNGKAHAIWVRFPGATPFDLKIWLEQAHWVFRHFLHVTIRARTTDGQWRSTALPRTGHSATMRIGGQVAAPPLDRACSAAGASGSIGQPWTIFFPG